MYGLTFSLLSSLHVTSHSTFFSRILKYLQQKNSVTQSSHYCLELLLSYLYYPFHYCLVNSYIFIIHVCSNVSSLGIFFWVLYSWSDFIAQLFLKMHYFPFRTLFSVCDYLCNHVKSFCVVVCVIILKGFFLPSVDFKFHENEGFVSTLTTVNPLPSMVHSW